MPTLRVVLDTNVLVSGFVYRKSIPGRIIGAWRQGALDIALSQYILDELARVLPRFDHKLRWQPARYANLIDILYLRTRIVEPGTVEAGTVRDPGDTLVLGTLLSSEADYLITGDKDLLALAGRYSIVTPAEFWRKHGN